MVETTLTPELIAAGEQFVRELDKRGLRPDAVFWFYVPDVGAWKLVVAEVKPRSGAGQLELAVWCHSPSLLQPLVPD